MASESSEGLFYFKVINNETVKTILF